MLDISVSYGRYKFLGYEFLTWLWFMIENNQELVSLEIGNRIVLENKNHDAIESVTIKGDDASLEEGILALRKGAVVTEINLFYQADGNEWQFTLKGESFDITTLKVPEVAPIESQDDVDGAVIEKFFLCDKVILLIDNIFKQFINIRLSDDWNKSVIPDLRHWIVS